MGICIKEIERNVKIHNVTPYQRTDVFSTVIPFTEADAYTGGQLSMQRNPAEIEQMGPTWPSSSAWRYAIVSAPVLLTPGQVANVEVFDGIVDPPSFAYSSVVSAALASTTYTFGITGYENLVFEDADFTTIYSGSYRRIRRARGRVPGTTIWVELTIGYKYRLSHAWFVLAYGDSDQSDPEVVHDLPEMAMLFDGVVPFLWEKIDQELNRFQTGTQTTVVLQNSGTWCDGEAQYVRGTLLWLDSSQTAIQMAELISPLFGCCDGWNGKGWFPWTSFQPGLPEGENSRTATQRGVTEYFQHRKGPWEEARLGLVPNPGRSGAQPDFTFPMLAEAQGIGTERLLAVGRSIVREAQRATHIRNADASPYSMRALAFTHTMEKGRPHYTSWNAGGLVLGKNRSLGGTEGSHLVAGPNGVEGFRGRDRQHWTANYLAAYALLTGDWAARLECEHITELILAEWTYNGFSAFNNGIGGGARDTGRVGQTAALMYLVTGDADLKQRILDRATVTNSASQWKGKSGIAHKPLYIWPTGAVPGSYPINATHPVWNPWQESLGVWGMYACYKVTEDATWREIAWECGKSTIMHGWQLIPNGRYALGDHMVYAGNGRELTQNEMFNLGWWQPYGGLGNGSEYTWNIWGMPCARIVRAEAVLREEQDVIDRCDTVLATVSNRGWESWEYKALP